MPLQACLGPGLLLLVGVVMMLWTWGTWPDVLIDFGAQLYYAWRLTAGQVLYTDFMHLKGPLSPYLNALTFRCFGVSFLTLVLFNVFLLTLLVGMLYRLLVVVGDRFSATIAGMVFLTLFAFGQFVGIGNYNFVCPYSHEVTHGLILGVAGVCGLAQYHRRPHAGWILAIGGAVGGCFLTDAQVFISAALALVLGLVMTLWKLKTDPLHRVQSWTLFAVGAIFPPLVAWGLLSLQMSPQRAGVGVLGSWPWILGGRASSSPFYASGIGMQHFQANLVIMLQWLSRYLVLFLPVVGLSLSVNRRTQPTSRWLLTGSVAVLVAALVVGQRMNWLDAARPFPLFLLLLFVSNVVWCVRARANHAEMKLAILRLTLVTFALLLLTKILLFTRIYHYGFALAMPATLIVTLVLVSWIPRWIDQRRGDGALFRAVALVVIGVAVTAHLQVIHWHLRQKIVPVGRGADAFLADGRGVFVNRALAEIRRRLRPDQTLAVLPEGVMLNYLTRRVNPTPYVNLVPLAFLLFGEENIVASFQHHPPDLIALVHKDTSEEGVRFFGRDYGQGLSAWIQAHYHEVALIGAKPLQDERFGILLLQKDSSATLDDRESAQVDLN